MFASWNSAVEHKLELRGKQTSSMNKNIFLLIHILISELFLPGGNFLNNDDSYTLKKAMDSPYKTLLKFLSN